MIKNLIWPLNIVFGLLLLFFYDFGIGGIGTFVFGIGVAGSLITEWLLLIVDKKRGKRLTQITTVTWVLAILSIFGLIGGWFTEGFDGFIWILPAAGFTLLGLILTLVDLLRK
jgi:hypothetical protein